MLAVPEQFAADTITREGEAGRRWIAALPGLIRDLCRRWELVIDGAAMHGALGLVVPVRRGAEPAALKVSWRDEATVEEAAALAAWDGRGAVRLLEADGALDAMLLERLDYRRSLDDLAIAEALSIAGGLLRRLAIRAPDGFRTLRAEAAALVERLPERWEHCGRPMSRRVLDQAREIAAQLGPTAGDILVNYDLHYTDVLASAREPWLAVDPKVVVGDLEYGPAQLLWNRLGDIEANGGLARQFRVLVEAAALDPALCRAWTLVRCVDYWLWGLSVGLTEDPVRCARIVAWLA